MNDKGALELELFPLSLKFITYVDEEMEPNAKPALKDVLISKYCTVADAIRLLRSGSYVW
jgi:hypothetical protein